MTNYNTLTQEQKESINPKLRELFELRESIKEKLHNNLNLCKPDLVELNSLRYDIISEIKGFQEAIKEIAIPQIDERIDDFEKIFLYFKLDKRTLESISNKIEELRKQREHLEWECSLE